MFVEYLKEGFLNHSLIKSSFSNVFRDLKLISNTMLVSSRKLHYTENRISNFEKTLNFNFESILKNYCLEEISKNQNFDLILVKAIKILMLRYMQNYLNSNEFVNIYFKNYSINEDLKFVSNFLNTQRKIFFNSLTNDIQKLNEPNLKYDLLSLLIFLKPESKEVQNNIKKYIKWNTQAGKFNIDKFFSSEFYQSKKTRKVTDLKFSKQIDKFGEFRNARIWSDLKILRKELHIDEIVISDSSGEKRASSSSNLHVIFPGLTAVKAGGGLKLDLILEEIQNLFIKSNIKVKFKNLEIKFELGYVDCLRVLCSDNLRINNRNTFNKNDFQNFTQNYLSHLRFAFRSDKVLNLMLKEREKVNTYTKSYSGNEVFESQIKESRELEENTHTLPSSVFLKKIRNQSLFTFDYLPKKNYFYTNGVWYENSDSVELLKSLLFYFGKDLTQLIENEYQRLQKGVGYAYDMHPFEIHNFFPLYI